MQRVCPDCHGAKLMTVNDYFIGSTTVKCATCHGQGKVFSKRPGKRGNGNKKTNRAKTPSYIRERRAEAKKLAKELRVRYPDCLRTHQS